MTAPEEEIIYCEVSRKEWLEIEKKNVEWKEIVVWYNNKKRFAKIIMPGVTMS